MIMKNLKTVLTLFLVFAFSIMSKAQEVNTDNLLRGLEAGFTITEMENMYNLEKIRSLKDWMLKNKYELKSDDGKLLEFEKNEVVSFYVFYQDDQIIEIRSSSSPQKFYQASNFEDKVYTKVRVDKKKSNSSGEEYEDTIYQKGNFSYAVVESPFYSISVWKD